MAIELTPEKFVDAWNLEELVSKVRELGEGFNHWHSPLMTTPRHLLEGVDIPESAKEFLSVAGLPNAFFSFCFHTLGQGVPLIPEVRPEAINNGIELPAIRYSMYYKIGEISYSDKDICVMKSQGAVFWLDYGDQPFWKSGSDLSGPHFVGSSIPQLAYLMLTFRDMFIIDGVYGNMAEKQPGRLANKMRTAMVKIDPAAVYGWKSGWGWTLQTVKDQMV